MNSTLRPLLFGAVLALLLVGPAVRPARAFTHPCVLLTAADLAELNARKATAPYATGYALFLADSHTKLSYTMQGPFVEVGRNPVFLNTTPWRNDMQAVFGLALQWKFTGDDAYAVKARDILLAWANTHTIWSGVEPYLELGDYAHYFCIGASILRSWSGWTAANTTTVKNYFNNVHWRAAQTDIPLRSANQGGAHLAAGMALATYLDDTVKFDTTIEAFRANGCAGLRTTQSNGQLGDSGRDMAHAYGELGHYARLAEIAWKAAGIDLFALENNRLQTCAEYWSTFNNGGSVPWIKAGTCYGIYLANDSEGSGPRTRVPEAHHILLGAYGLRKGLAMPQTQAYLNGNPDDWKSWVFRKTADVSTAVVPAAIIFPAASPLAAGLTRVEVGGATPAGSMSNTGSSWTVSGGGADIWGDGAADSFTFAYQQVTGDVAMIARVTALTNPNVSAKAGLMIRENLSGSSKMAAIVQKPVVALETSGRGGNAYSHYANEQTYAAITLPYWVKIERRGTRITTFSSSDGTNWTPAKVYDFTMGGTYYIGLCVTSHLQGALATATFTDVSLTAVFPAAASPEITSAPTVSGAVGSAFSYTISATNTPASFSATGLPAGLTLNSLTGAITGTLTTLGTSVVTLTATNAAGATTTTLSVTVTPPVSVASRIVAFAARSSAGTGERTLIMGFTVAGAGTSLVVRGVGPALAALNVPNTLVDPQLALYSGTTAIASNDDWGTNNNPAQIVTQSARVGLFPLAPGSKDSALLAVVDPGTYTTRVNGANAAIGTALAEVYLAEGNSAARLTGVSTRMQVNANEGVLIAGLVIAGSAPKTVLVRGIGPALAAFGVTGVLADPQVTVYSGGTVIGSNDDWGRGNDAAQLAATFAQVGEFPLPLGSKDAALLITLPPGGYTVQLSGVGNTTGVALMEVYETP